MRIYLSLILLLITTNVFAITAGSVIFSQGKSFSTSLTGQTKVLAKGSQIESGDTIKTEADAMLQLKMIDGAKIALQPNTTFKIDEYLYSGAEDGSERAFFSLVKGALRTVTGAIGHKNKKNYLANTPTATIGVRGTEYALRFDGATVVTVGDGAITLCNQSSCLDLDVGQSGIVLDKTSAPTFTDKTVVQEDKEKKDLAELLIAKDAEHKFKPNDDSRSETLVEIPALPPEVPVVVPPLVPVVVTVLPPANNISLASGTGNLNIFVQTSGANINAGLTGANMVFDANGVLTSYRDVVSTSIGGDISANAEAFGDGIIAWGRWSSGTYQTGSVPLPMNTFSYTAALNSSATPAAVLSTLVGTYTAFGSSSPIVVNSDGTTIEVGSPNTVIGNLNVNFVAGTVGYSLTIPLPSQTFTISGIANFINNSPTAGDSRFLGAGIITSTGTACGGTACVGIIPFGPNIAGTIVGLNGERAGAIYGFNSGIGVVSGSVVFKP